MEGQERNPNILGWGKDHAVYTEWVFKLKACDIISRKVRQNEGFAKPFFKWRGVRRAITNLRKIKLTFKCSKYATSWNCLVLILKYPHG